ncbi:hypothetical protein ILUMI_26786 [Ignelater luminosus]|uniref:Major facilitator superfamily (MFS) profile domain-containing protein n=1 Tax=Ignelater luminosus TaxID=2038154 RepID=A0A8K0FYC4_IGNLU|nr:hypothetical protein ILUMI_26786 [Ignelater luminosus]
MLIFFKPKTSEKNHELSQIIVILIASFGGLSTGLIFSWSSPAIPQLVASNSFTLEEASYFSVISTISMGIVAPIYSKLLDVIGRKNTLLLVAVPQLIAWILTALAENIWIYYLAASFSGIGIVGTYVTVPVYVCEIAEPKVRGTWGNVVSIFIFLGIFLINVIGAYNDIKTIALICGWLPIIYVLLFFSMPESPYYLLMKGREEEANKALTLLRWRKNVEKELLTLKADVARQISESGTMKELFSITSNRKALIMCVGMRMTQQFSGLGAFEMYTQYLFQQAGGDVSYKTSAMIVSGTLALSVSLASLVVERCGRRPLMLFSSLGCALVLTIETIYYSISQFTNADVSNFGWLPLVGMLSYMVLCGSGLAILPTLVAGEIYSASIKSKAVGVTNAATAVSMLIVPKVFQLLTSNFGIFSPFCFFTICCYLGVIFSYFCVIETKGKTLEEIQQELKGNKRHSSRSA